MLGSAGPDAKTLVELKVASAIDISAGTGFGFESFRGAYENARIDYVRFVPVGAVEPPPPPPPEPPPPPPPAPPPAASFLLEAEAMSLASYAVRSGSFASNGKYIEVTAATGSATAAFSGPAGAYDVYVGYFDETDGTGRLTFKAGGAVVDSWQLDQPTGSAGPDAVSFIERKVASGLTLATGTTLGLDGGRSGYEYARVDYIRFVPVDAPATIDGTSAGDLLTGGSQGELIRGFAGNDHLIGNDGNDTLIGGTGKDILDGSAGTDTASYADSAGAVIADLGAGLASHVARIMPLGDSITFGTVEGKTGLISGGYRTEVWQRFGAEGLRLDFVGSQSDGPSALGDRDHEGHPGFKIAQIDAAVSGYLSSAKPDIVLLMIGTNDTGSSADTVSAMIGRLGALIDKIAGSSPDLEVLVAPIPPIRSDAQPAERVQKALDYNAAIPGLVAAKQAAGKKVDFVDMPGLTQSDISPPGVDNGLHPTAQGYQKIGGYWHDALLGLGTSQGTLAVDRDTLISIENLVGSAFDDILIGNAGANVLEDGKGNDRLTGGGGPDSFVMRGPGDGVDVITDFGVGDRLEFSAFGFGGGLTAGVKLGTAPSPTGSLVAAAVPVPLGAGPVFLYDTDDGGLSFDRDGAGGTAAVPVATLLGAPALTVDDFVFIA